MVLIFCVEFWELSHLTCDLSQAEKKITVVTSWATDKITCIFTQNDNFDHFEWNRCHLVHLLSLQQHLFSSQLEIGHVLNRTNPEIQHRKWGPLSLVFLINQEKFSNETTYRSRIWRTIVKGKFSSIVNSRHRRLKVGK